MEDAHDAKAQGFAHRLVEFADLDACVKFFSERSIDFDRANDMGWSVLMSVCASGRDDLVGIVVDRTEAVDCATNANRTTVLHLTAMSKNTRVMAELVATAERKQKLRKVLDQPNANGDTPLMMACVAKNVTAVQLLLELGADMCAVNASGLNALMCAARVGEDPRPGAPSLDEMMERSAAILKTLLTHGAVVNVAEKAGGNTALHLAVLSENPEAVKALIRDAPDLDITLRNEAANTALDLCRRISGVASVEMEDLLSLEWAQYEEEAAQRSAKVEQELMELAVKEAEDTLGRKQPAAAKAGKRKSKKTKKKAKTSETASRGEDSTAIEAKNDQTAASAGEEDSSGPSSTAMAGRQTPPDQQVHRIAEQRFDGDEGDWQSVLPKKSRRKGSVGDSAKPPSKHNPKTSHRRPSTSKSVKKNSRAARPKAITTPPQTTQEPGTTPVLKATSAAPKAPWARHPTATPAKASASVSPRSQVTSDDSEEDRPSLSYELLNGSFQRTFPVAAELEIGVDKFLIASSVSDRELEPTDSLSISQVEALQEAHWQAYHYLSEKKIELTRVLEAQRMEAQFTLQQELMQMQ